MGILTENMRILPSLSLPVLFAGPSFFVAEGSSDELCQDQTVADQCNDKCAANFADCMADCAEQSCQYECVAEFGRCGPECPCGDNCPGGCEGCPSPFCQCVDILHNGEHNYCMHRATSRQNYCIGQCETDTCVFDCSQAFMNEMKNCPCRSECVGGCPCNDSTYECRDYAMILDAAHRIEGKLTSVDGEIFDRRRFGPKDKLVLDKAFYMSFKEEVYMFGGATTPRQIAVFGGPVEAPCEIEVSDIELGFDFDQINGTAVLVENEVGFEDDVIYFCFAHKDTACFEFDGENSSPVVLETDHSHRRGGVGIYQTQVFAVGGVNSDGSLSSKVEILGRNGWSTVADFPETTGISDIAVISDQESDRCFTLGGHNGDNDVQDVHVFGRNASTSTFEFTWIGRLSRRMSQVSSLQFGSRILLVGATIERVEIEDDASYAKGYHIRELDPPLQYPVLFPAEPDLCLSSCTDFCFAGDLW